MDEAASRLKIELDSLPTEIDQLERQGMQLEMERQALAKEKDDASKERLEKVEREIAELKEKSDGYRAQWLSEKEVIDAANALQEENRESQVGVGESTNVRATSGSPVRFNTESCPISKKSRNRPREN